MSSRRYRLTLGVAISLAIMLVGCGIASRAAPAPEPTELPAGWVWITAYSKGVFAETDDGDAVLVLSCSLIRRPVRLSLGWGPGERFDDTESTAKVSLTWDGVEPTGYETWEKPVVLDLALPFEEDRAGLVAKLRVHSTLMVNAQSGGATLVAEFDLTGVSDALQELGAVGSTCQ